MNIKDNLNYLKNINLTECKELIYYNPNSKDFTYLLFDKIEIYNNILLLQQETGAENYYYRLDLTKILITHID